MIIDCIADLHGHYPELEGGDLLIVAGDLTASDSMQEHLEFCDWLLKQKYSKIIWISGNHDNRYQFYGLKGFFLSCDSRDKSHISYLCDSGTEFQYEVLGGTHTLSCMGVQIYETKKLKIWGSPWTKTFEGMNPKCKAFTVDTEEELAEKWALIPEDTDILITHGPPFTIKDGKNPNENFGSTSLMDKISNINLKLHVFGHIHEGYGIQDMRWFKLKNGFKGGVYINCSLVNEHYKPVNKPVSIIL